MVEGFAIHRDSIIPVDSSGWACTVLGDKKKMRTVFPSI